MILCRRTKQRRQCCSFLARYAQLNLICVIFLVTLILLAPNAQVFPCWFPQWHMLYPALSTIWSRQNQNSKCQLCLFTSWCLDDHCCSKSNYRSPPWRRQEWTVYGTLERNSARKFLIKLFEQCLILICSSTVSHSVCPWCWSSLLLSRHIAGTLLLGTTAQSSWSSNLWHDLSNTGRCIAHSSDRRQNEIRERCLPLPKSRWRHQTYISPWGSSWAHLWPGTHFNARCSIQWSVLHVLHST